jgi:hypothetical protein
MVVKIKTNGNDLLKPIGAAKDRYAQLLNEPRISGCSRYSENEMYPRNLKSLKLHNFCNNGDITTAETTQNAPIE